MAARRPSSRVDLQEVVASLYGPDGSVVRRIGPGEPLEPTLPDGEAPRTWIYSPQYNTVSRPRAIRGLAAFSQLRALGDFDLVRIAIADVTNQITGMGWTVRPKRRFKDKGDQFSKQIDEASKQIERIDELSGRDWQAWLSAAIEAILVTDSLALLPRYTLAKKPIGLQLIDGTSVVPLITEFGTPPDPPNDAYQQIVNGYPETGFTTEELWYVPKNRRDDSPYGRSPVEMVLMTVNIAIRRATHDLVFFGSGNIPDSLYAVPPDWTPAQIAEFQLMFDQMIEGNAAKRSGYMKFVPNGGQYIPTKTREWHYDEQEWLARIIAWAFGVSPLPVAKQMNRSTAEVQESSSLESGVRPVALHIARVVTRYVNTVMGFEQLEFAWDDDETEDPTVVYQRNIAYFGAGLLQVNRVKELIGEKPINGGDVHLINTASGPIILEDLLARRGGDPVSSELVPNDGGKAVETPGQKSPGKIADASDLRDELRKWRRFETRCLAKGRRSRAFRSDIIPQWTRLAVMTKLSKATTPRDVSDAFEKAELESLSIESETMIASAVMAWLDDHADLFISWATAKLPSEKVAKANDEPPSPDVTGLWDDLLEGLQAAFAKGGSDGASALGLVFDLPPESALDFAKRHAAELVGMKWIGGTLVDNPNKQYAITETVRRDVAAKVTTAIEQGWSADALKQELRIVFGSTRAATIARTETAFSYNSGAVHVYRELELDYVEILDGEGCLPDGHLDGSPSPEGTPGVIEPGSQANGQVWTIDQFQAHLIGHPNCVRAAIPFKEQQQ